MTYNFGQKRIGTGSNQKINNGMYTKTILGQSIEDTPVPVWTADRSRNPFVAFQNPKTQKIYKIDAKSKEISDDEKIEIFKEGLKRPKVLSGIVLIAVLMIFAFSADAWQQYRFETANRAYTMMEKQEYAEAAELMEQYLDVSWTPYWKMMELVNGKNNKFSKAEAEAALEKCREMITEE